MPCLTCDLDPCVCQKPRLMVVPPDSLYVQPFPYCVICKAVRLKIRRLSQPHPTVCRWCETGTAYHMRPKKEQT